MRYLTIAILILVIGLDISVCAEEVRETIETKAGQSFVITMDSNRLTGYQWQLAEPVDKNLIQFLGSEYKRFEDGAVGTPGKENWIFRAVGEGKATISFEYVRPWGNVRPLALEADHSTKKSFVVIIKK